MLAGDLLRPLDQPPPQAAVLRLAFAIAADVERRAVDVHLADHGATRQLREKLAAGLLVVGQRQAQEAGQVVVRRDEAQEVLLGDIGVVDQVIKMQRARRRLPADLAAADALAARAALVQSGAGCPGAGSRSGSLPRSAGWGCRE